MKKVKKYAAILLAAALAAGTMGGCQQQPAPQASSGGAQAASNGSTASEPEKMQELTIKMMASENPKYPISPDKQKVFEWIREKTGVTLEIEAVPDSNYAEKKPLCWQPTTSRM